MSRLLLALLASGGLRAASADNPACAGAPSVESARQALFDAQTELAQSKGFKATSKALDRVSRAQSNLTLAFSCQSRFTAEPADAGSAQRRLPPVSTVEGMAPPGYSPFQTEDAGAAPGIRYNQPGGMANAPDQAGASKPVEAPKPEPDPAPAVSAAPAPAPRPQPAREEGKPAADRRPQQGPATPPAPSTGSRQADPERLLDAAGRQLDYGDFEGALRTVRRALSSDPKNAAARGLEAQILCGMGRIEEARAAARRALAIDPLDPGAREAAFCRAGSPRGSILVLIRSAERKMEFGDYLGALMDAERALAADPASAAAYRLKAQVLCGLGRYEEAREAASKAVAIDGQDPAAFEVLAWALANLGDYSGAAKAASRALELNEGSAFAFAVRAFARERLGDRGGGLSDMAQAAALNPAYSAQYAAAKAGQALSAPSPTGKAAPAAAKQAEESSDPPLWPAVTVVALVLLLLGGCALIVLRRRPES